MAPDDIKKHPRFNASMSGQAYPLPPKTIIKLNEAPTQLCIQHYNIFKNSSSVIIFVPCFLAATALEVPVSEATR